TSYGGGDVRGRAAGRAQSDHLRQLRPALRREGGRVGAAGLVDAELPAQALEADLPARRATELIAHQAPRAVVEQDAARPAVSLQAGGAVHGRADGREVPPQGRAEAADANHPGADADADRAGYG